jgi:hypothetical protein
MPGEGRFSKEAGAFGPRLLEILHPLSAGNHIAVITRSRRGGRG